ncbi:MAG: NAD(P)/FAD-dependent oxidoreductase [Bacteroidota bacterium]
MIKFIPETNFSVLTQNQHIVIIGNGISGVTLARHIRKRSQYSITIISEESNYFFSRTALMYVYMGHMKWNHLKPYEDGFWSKNKINILQKRVTTVLTDENELVFEDNTRLSYDKLVFASGSTPKKLGLENENAKGVQGLYSKQDLELLEKNAPSSEHCKRAVIVGGGLIGVELAEMLSTRNIPVTYLVRENGFWGNVLPKNQAEMIGDHIKKHGIDLRFETELKSIKTDQDNRVKSIITSKNEEIECDLLCISIGVQPNINFLKSSDIKTNRGILVNEYLQTNIANIFAIGDCVEHKNPPKNRPKIESVWYTGRIMGETLAQSICGNLSAYQPGNWFNSAKFFDIEYQTYGWVFPEPKNGNAHFSWKHPTAEKSIHIEFEKTNQRIIGINSLGIRLRHEVMDLWLKENRPINFVITNFKHVNFDAEFSPSHQKELIQAYKKFEDGNNS